MHPKADLSLRSDQVRSPSMFARCPIRSQVILESRSSSPVFRPDVCDGLQSRVWFDRWCGWTGHRKRFCIETQSKPNEIFFIEISYKRLEFQNDGVPNREHAGTILHACVGIASPDCRCPGTFEVSFQTRHHGLGVARPSRAAECCWSVRTQLT